MPTPPAQAAAFEAVHVESEEEVKDSSTQSRGWVKKAALALALGLGVVGFMAMPKATRFCNGLDLGAFQGKSNLGLDAQMVLKADALKGVKKPSAAEKIVLKAMKSTGRKYSKHFQQREVRALPADPADAAREMLTKDEIVAYKATRKERRIRKATNVYCAFNVLEAQTSSNAVWKPVARADFKEQVQEVSDESRKAATNRKDELAEAALREIISQLKRPGNGGYVWVDDWNERFNATLGTVRNFIESKPDKFQVTPTTGRGYRVMLVSETRPSKPVWRKLRGSS